MFRDTFSNNEYSMFNDFNNYMPYNYITEKNNLLKDVTELEQQELINLAIKFRKDYSDNFQNCKNIFCEIAELLTRIHKLKHKHDFSDLSLKNENVWFAFIKTIIDIAISDLYEDCIDHAIIMWIMSRKIGVCVDNRVSQILNSYLELKNKGMGYLIQYDRIAGNTKPIKLDIIIKKLGFTTNSDDYFLIYNEYDKYVIQRTFN